MKKDTAKNAVNTRITPSLPLMGIFRPLILTLIATILSMTSCVVFVQKTNGTEHKPHHKNRISRIASTPKNPEGKNDANIPVGSE